MQSTNRNYKTLVIRDIQKQIEVKMIEKFLILNKSIDQIKSFEKSGQDILLDFHQQKDALTFIQNHNHMSKIMAKKFNISYAFFTSNNQQQFPRFETFGINQQNRRQIYQVCNKYSPCYFQLKYENNKLDPTSLIYFQKIDNIQLEQLKNLLLPVNVKLRVEDNYGDFDRFRVSIQLYNFAKIETESSLIEQQEQLILKIQTLLKQFTNEQPVGLQIHPYSQNQIKVKAYFRFKTVDRTFQIFEMLRLHLLQMPQHIRARLFYFKKDSNSFYTLFTSGLLNTQQLGQKLFEDELLKTFRKINPSITQILLNSNELSYTGKIYFKTQADGKDFLANYGRHRQYYYMFYKPGTNVIIDMFQTERQIKKKYQYKKNANNILSHLQQTRKEAEKVPIQPLGFIPTKTQYKKPNYYNKFDQKPKNNYHQNSKYQYRQKQADQVPRSNQYKYRQKKQEPSKQDKIEKKQVVKFKQEDFPSL